MNRASFHGVAHVMIVLLALAAVASPGRADPVTAGNLLVSDAVFSGPGRIREFTPAGVLVQTFSFPSNDQPRDIVVDGNGNIQIYNGTFSPLLTALNPVTGTVVSNSPFAGWSTINNITYGGMAAFGDYAFVSDMSTAGVGTPNGIIRFHIGNLSGQRFGSGPANGSGDVIDLAAGPDGLYAQFPGTSPGGFQLDVYDPLTLAFQRRINLAVDLRAIAVDQNGDIFAVSFNDANVYHFNRNGVLLRAVNTGDGGFSDIDIDGTGRLLMASGDNLLLSDRTLSSFTSLNVGTISPVGIFSTWVQPPLPVPEPGSLTLLCGVVVGLAGSAWRHRKGTA